MLINGKWVPARSGKVFEVQDPATEMRLATVAEGDAADIDDAVRAARNALEMGGFLDESEAKRNAGRTKKR